MTKLLQSNIRGSVQEYIRKNYAYHSNRPNDIRVNTEGRGIACRIRLDCHAGSQPFEKVAKHGKKGSINTI